MIAIMDARNLYRESLVRGASPVRQVILLYEQMVQDLRCAVMAIDDNRIEDRTNAINHAIVIIGHLQNKLNHKAGGEIARNLEHFYDLSRRKLIEAQCTVSKEILHEQITLLLNLRDAWTAVDRAEAGRSSSPGDENAHADWKG
jgi:flagellar secretion chaperone FliS